MENGPELPEESGPYADEGGEALQGIVADGRALLEEAKIRGMGTKETQSTWSPFPTSSEDEEMTYDQARLHRRFRKGRRPGGQKQDRGN
jgi:hypothetical protein